MTTTPMRLVLAVVIPVVALAALLAAPDPAAADRRPIKDSHSAYFFVEPGVYPRRAACSPGPAPAAPVIVQRPSPRARLLVRVTGDGSLCRARWTADRAGPRSLAVSLVPTAAVDRPSTCGGTCTVDLLVTRLGRGTYQVSVGATTITARAP